MPSQPQYHPSLAPQLRSLLAHWPEESSQPSPSQIPLSHSLAELQGLPSAASPGGVASASGRASVLASSGAGAASVAASTPASVADGGAVGVAGSMAGELGGAPAQAVAISKMEVESLTVAGTSPWP